MCLPCDATEAAIDTTRTVLTCASLAPAQRPLKAQLTAEVAAARDDAAADAIRIKFDTKEKALESEMDHKPLESESPPLARTRPPSVSHVAPCNAVHLELEVAYNFLSK